MWIYLKPQNPGLHLVLSTHWLHHGYTLAQLHCDHSSLKLHFGQSSPWLCHELSASSFPPAPPLSSFTLAWPSPRLHLGPVLALQSIGVALGLHLLGSAWVATTLVSTSLGWAPGYTLAPPSFISTVGLHPDASVWSHSLASPTVTPSLTPPWLPHLWRSLLPTPRPPSSSVGLCFFVKFELVFHCFLFCFLCLHLFPWLFIV